MWAINIHSAGMSVGIRSTVVSCPSYLLTGKCDGKSAFGFTVLKCIAICWNIYSKLLLIIPGHSPQIMQHVLWDAGIHYIIRPALYVIDISRMDKLPFSWKEILVNSKIPGLHSEIRLQFNSLICVFHLWLYLTTAIPMITHQGRFTGLSLIYGGVYDHISNINCLLD